MKRFLILQTFLVILSGHLFAQKKVEGTVKDGSGEPLPGVNVMVKGVSQGTVTNMEGYFIMDNLPDTAVLVFSFLGMLPEEVEVGQQTEINMTLIEDITSLDAVIVVGYGEVKRANLTGAVDNMTTENIEDIPTSSLSTLLEGRLAGVKVGLATGRPGAESSISIRKSSSFGVAESPLYVIDGIILDDDNDNELFNQLDPSEIESISVLKDASAAVYGARASGGVIMVTTKQGKVGKPKINYSGSYGFSEATQLPEMLSAYDQASMLNYIYENDKKNSAGKYDSYTDDELEAFKNTNYNWLDGVWNTSSQTRHTLNVNGGSEAVRYFVGGSYYNENGNIEGYSVDRFSVRSNVTADITDNLRANVKLSLSQKKSENPYYSGENQADVARAFFKKLLTTPQWIPPTIDGKAVGNGFDTWQPYGLLESGSYKSGHSFNSSIYGGLDYSIPFVDGLKAGVSINYNISNGSGKKYLQDYPIYTFATEGEYGHIISNEQQGSTVVNNKEGYEESTSNSNSYQLNTYISYSKQFGANHISAKLVYEQSENENTGFGINLTGAEISDIDQRWAYSQNGITTSSSPSESGRLSYVGRFNYDYAGKYLIESSFRYEASSIFAPKEAWGFFPSGSAGWILSEENFLKDKIQLISFMKVRASVGLVGNDRIGAFQWKYLYSGNQTGPIFGGSITNAIEAQKDGLNTPTVTWQKTWFYDVGADIRLFQNKVDIGLDYYYKFTYDILGGRQAYLPTSAGIKNRPDENYGEMFAKGFEVKLGYNGKVGNDLRYDVSGNFSWDKALKVLVDQSTLAIGRWDDQTKNAMDNQPGYTCLGIIRTDADLAMVKEMYDEIDGQPIEKGMLYYKDIRGENYSEGPDGKIDGNDMSTIAEHTSPPFNYSLSMGGSWKGLDMHITFTGEFGHKVFVNKDEMVLPTATSNVFSFWNDYWTPENVDASMPRPYRYGLEEQISTFWMRDGNTLRLKSLNIGYTPPIKLLTQYKLPKFRVYFSAHNLWTIISPFDFKDPNVSRAYDYPMTKTFNMGINITL